MSSFFGIIRRIFTWVIYTLLVLVAVYGVGRFYVVYTESGYEGERKPYIQLLTQKSVIIRWQSVNEYAGVVYYGEDVSNLQHSDSEPEPGLVHEVQLDQLKPATRYYYSVASPGSTKGKGNNRHWFVTAPETGSVQPVRIWVIGDSGVPGQNSVNVRNAALSWSVQNAHHGKLKPDMLLTLGDNAYPSGANISYQWALFDVYEAILVNTVLWPIYGNHDARRWAFYDIFNLPEKAEAGGVASGTESYFSVDYANVHLVFLDSQDSDRSKDSEMMRWLENDLSQNKQDWLIALFHHPPYTRGTHDSDNERDSNGRMKDVRENFLPVLENYGVDVVLSGHSHMYERSKFLDCHYGNSGVLHDYMVVDEGAGDGDEGRAYHKPEGRLAHQGAVYVVAGSSSKLDMGPVDHPVMAVSILELGSLMIDVYGNSLKLNFINDKGESSDSFSIVKDPDAEVHDYSQCAAYKG